MAAAREEAPSPLAIRLFRRLVALVHLLIVALFVCAAFILIGMAGHMGLNTLRSTFDPAGSQTIIEAVGLLAAAVVALQIAQTIAEEEVVRGAHISAPTRVRRFLSRFLVVIVIALALEGLVATFRALHEDPSQLPYAAALISAVGLLLIGWGVFVRMNRYAEELEPEAMKEAKREDRKLRV